ncbi:type III PLP-dependent enzyme [Nocardioides sp.]|uniref:type III PLP-dependent enzyme n=1 Tax=Nocardioides sp. TaxID=35761 RepID=UPI002ED25BD3
MTLTNALTAIGAPALPEGDTPRLYVDTDVVADAYVALESALPGVRLHYAVKANPAAEILARLQRLGCAWDVASPGEIRDVLTAGGRPEDLSYGHPVKHPRDIAYAYEVGVRAFTFDSPDELDKLLRHAPGALLLVRITTSGSGADWALSSKFGCGAEDAERLLQAAARADHPVGVAFHVGSQQRDPDAWLEPLRTTALLRDALRRHGADLAMVDIGGGFPCDTFDLTPRIEEYGRRVMAAIRAVFDEDVPPLMAEPGRALVAHGGVLETEVLLVADRADGRWVYLDAGVFGGLAETLGESIKYRLDVRRDGRPLSGRTLPVVLAGPTCDSVDVLYREHRYALPADLRCGDRVLFHATGAYTTTYSSVGFNGLPPLSATYR